MTAPASAPRPFLKWVGGKRQLLAKLSRRLPKDLGQYHEPFLGGGALFFDLAGRGKIKRAFLSDANAELVNGYSVVRDSVEALIRNLEGQQHSETEFYRIRALNPESLSPLERATRLIYLNKTCYNGLYRVNSKGQFNAPFGRYKNPKICDVDNLRACSKVLQHAEISCRPFEVVLKSARRGDFAYFDPPYHPVSPTSNFAGYARGGFGEGDHVKLRDVFAGLAAKGCRALLSNSFSPFTRKLFSGWKIETVSASRAVNSKSTGRGLVKEILVRNY